VSALTRPRISAALLALPAALLVVLGWTHRWVSDDGFINFRVADHLLHGNGPVFNAGERVEVFTSPLWIAILAVADGLLWFAEVEWISVVLGIALSGLGLLAATFAAARLARDAGGGSLVLPLGALVVVALPPFWDYATSGLETGLSLAWLGVAFWLLVGVHHEQIAGEGAPDRRFTVAAVVVGLGPLVRPDLALFALGFLAVLAALRWPAGGRRVAALVAVAAAIPLAYQLFRMAYFGAIVPNTAFAKEAGRAWWDQGWDYLENLADPYLLVLPVALLLVACGAEVVRAVRRHQVATALAFALPTLCGLLHALYVVRVGGDFMHGRLLLPSLFGALLPFAAVAPRDWRVYALPVAAVLVWSVVVGVSTKPPPGFVTVKPGEFQFTSPIVDERRWYAGVAQVEHPVEVEDYERFVWARHGKELRARAERGEPTVALYEAIVPGWRPSVEADVVTGIGNIGMVGELR
jgi:arabinofuranosyltransferase